MCECVNSAVEPSFKVVFAEKKKVLTGPINSAWNPLKKRHSLGNVQNTLPKLMLKQLSKFKRSHCQYCIFIPFLLDTNKVA